MSNRAEHVLGFSRLVPPRDSPAMAGSVISTNNVTMTRLLGTPQDMIRKSHALLVDRFPSARVRHKPLSILRQEGRRALENLFETEFPTVKKPERDQLIEGVLGEAAGFGPLEELFRDESLSEVMVLAATQVIARRGDAWVPTSVRFRNAAHLRGYFRRLADTGEQITTTTPAMGGFDVRMSNGFRVIGILPPEVLDLSPTAVFVRGEAPPLPPPPTTPPRSGIISNPSRVVPPMGGSTGVPMAAATRVPVDAKPVSQMSVFSGALPSPPSRVVANPPERMPEPQADPYLRVRQRVTERIVRKCEAAGVYDLRVISTPELQRVILAHVEDLNADERLGMDEPVLQRLTLEILAGMNR